MPPAHRDHTATFRFYEELNEFLPAANRKRDVTYRFRGTPSVKHAIEAHHVPHTEVDLVLVNGSSVGFDHRLADGDRVAVYPVFEGLDIAPLARLRAEPLRRTAFLCDVHLGKLTRLLRLLGFDAAFAGNLPNGEIVRRAVAQHRILLTRDRRMLHARVLTHGCCLHSQDPETQVHEVLRRFDLYRDIRPFTRFLACGGELAEVPKTEVFPRLEPKTRLYYDVFGRCQECARVYWRGSHFTGLAEQVQRIRDAGPRGEPEDPFGPGI